MTRTAMMMVAASVFLLGCPDDPLFTDTADTAVTDWYTGPYEIAFVDYECVSDTLTVEIETDGWADGMELWLANTGDGNWPSNPTAIWDETHVLDDTHNVNFDEETGAWDIWEIDLDIVTDAEDVVTTGPNQTTLSGVGCPDHDGESWAYMAVMFGSGAVDDCAIWGYEPVEYYNTYLANADATSPPAEIGGCICFDC